MDTELTHPEKADLPQRIAESNIVKTCNSVIRSIADKADKNKRRARASSITLTAATAFIPVSIICADWFPPASSYAFIFGRLLPAVLAAVAAILSRWIQIEQPHQRWTLYRHWHRHFEVELLRYQNAIGKYASDDKDEKLAEVLAKGQLELDDQWASLVPRSRDLTTGDPGKA